mgnify:FL=1|jgi:hypothetical protein|tara:strand:+ start:642 stop:974 length:333 start_codon:yes stop_codon:yes gene_type:complete
MAFVRKKTKVYPWPVEVKRPSETVPGEFETTKFIGKFARLDRSSLDKFENEDEFSALSKILVGWEDVNEEDDTPITFSKAVLKEFSEDVDFVKGVLDAFKAFYGNAQSGN